MPVNATFGSIVHAGKYRWQIPPVNATSQPWHVMFNVTGNSVSVRCRQFYTILNPPKTVEEQWLFYNNNYVKGCIYLYVSPLYCGLFVLFSMTISILSTLIH